MERAACVGEDPERWFPKSTGNGARVEAKAAAAVCDTCPVKELCRDYAKALRIPCGVWGGSLRGGGQIRAVKIPPSHGTNAAYQRHVERHERACDQCREAHRIFNSRWARR
jgi:WhiB family transcriptional regulator, redox-sensing transcriptional regulator